MLTRKIKALFSKGVRPHFGQSGEDVLIRSHLRGVKNGVYLDLGAYDPFILSNTAMLWAEGWNGCNVDANPFSVKRFIKHRPDDINIHGAIITESEKRDGKSEVALYFERASKDGLSATGSIVQRGEYKSSIIVPCLTIEEILEKGQFKIIDYLNVDLEGYDLKIILEFPFEKFSPKVIAIEDYYVDCAQIMKSPISDALMSKGYKLRARSSMTSVFVRN